MNFKNIGSNKFLKTHFSLLAVLFVLIVILTITCPNFGKVANFAIIVRQLSLNVLVAMGMTVVLIGGGIDLSVGGVFAAAGIIAGLLMTKLGIPIWLLFVIAMAVGSIFGLANGVLASFTNIPPFIITLGMSYVASGTAYVFGEGRSVSVIIKPFNNLGNGNVGIIPIPVFFMVTIAVILGVILSKTRLGRGIYATGSNVTAALYSGINIRKTRLFVYAVCGMLGAISATLNTAKVFVAQPDAGAGSEIDAIAAVVIGGTSFEGGKGTIFGTILGTLLITVIGNGMNQLGITYFWQKIVKGIIIVLAVLVDERMNVREKRRAMNAGK
ncbi:MAG: ABC transporter permease [Tannerella sp.]|jgi:ribose transport system permease protein|nr:ABC transporter permease [Tannerella sp.]